MKTTTPQLPTYTIESIRGGKSCRHRAVDERDAASRHITAHITRKANVTPWREQSMNGATRCWIAIDQSTKQVGHPFLVKLA